MIMLACTMLSIPAYVLFWSGRSLNNPDTADQDQQFHLNTFIASLSLANLGEKSYNIMEFPLDKDRVPFKMFCLTGKIGRIQDHGIAMKLRTSEEIDYFDDTYCELDVSFDNQERFTANCAQE